MTEVDLSRWEPRRPHLHGDPGAGVAVQAAAQHVGKGGVGQWREGHLVRLVGDGVHLLDEGQVGEGGVAVHHLVQNAAQAPQVRRPPHLAFHSSSECVCESLSLSLSLSLSVCVCVCAWLLLWSLKSMWC
jgi:hypothetical protein